jgi:hypothetical protein
MALGHKILLSVIFFGFGMVVTSIFCEWEWDRHLVGIVYLNTDDIDGGGYISPGHWVGNDEGFPVVTQDKLNLDPKISDPDELLAGWSKSRLWLVWWCYFGGSLIVSTGLAALPWIRFGKGRVQAD